MSKNMFCPICNNKLTSQSYLSDSNNQEHYYNCFIKANHNFIRQTEANVNVVFFDDSKQFKNFFPNEKDIFFDLNSISDEKISKLKEFSLLLKNMSILG